MNKLKYYLAGIFCVCLMFGLSHLALASATISGTLTDNTGAPIHGIYLEAYLEDGDVFTDTSSDDGTYVIDIDSLTNYCW